jgi:hypothetical protein
MKTGENIVTNLCIAIGTAFGPVCIITLFLKVGFDQIIREAAVESFKDEITSLEVGITKRLKECKKHSIELYNNAETLNILKKCGIYSVFEDRTKVYPLIKEWLKDDENDEFIFIGTSFRGLYWQEKGDPSILDIIEEKVSERHSLIHNETSLYFKFIFTHPAFAYLREKAEGEEREDQHQFKIREEILMSVLMLRLRGIPEKNIKFFIGTPTIFGVMTKKAMYVNPYPYKRQAYTSVGFAIEKLPSEKSPIFSLYKNYRDSNFVGVWNDLEITTDWKDDKVDVFWESQIGDVTSESATRNLPAKLKRLNRDLINKFKKDTEHSG